MQKPIRRAAQGIAAMLLLASGGAWVRSCQFEEGLTYDVLRFRAVSASGMFYLSNYDVSSTDEPIMANSAGWGRFAFEHSNPAWGEYYLIQPIDPDLGKMRVDFGFAGLRFQRAVGIDDRWSAHAIAVPYWWPMLLLLLVLARLWVSHRVAVPHDDLKCRRCGYDLRASPERCPECGAAVDRGVTGSTGGSSSPV